LNSRPIAWTRNTVRNQVRSSALGGILGWAVLPPVRKLRVVSATRLDEKAFWKTSALGRSLAMWRQDHRLSFDIAFSNSVGLPALYNAAIDGAGAGDALVFVHDDVWLMDGRWVDKVLLALGRFDVVGVAGNRRRVRGQQFWLTAGTVGESIPFDVPHVSGAVYHGPDPQHAAVTTFGPMPAACELLDGLFLAVRADLAKRWRVRFDERFMFHFYDMDFCRSARAAGWRLGTWPIDLLHQSGGGGFKPAWREALRVYQSKWRS
jgi:GT2 family glycosyltransferase